MSLKASHSHREKGNEHFKRGDYSSAHQAYSTSLSHLPSTYPLTIVLLTNRALTALKTGEPKIAVTDSDSAISIIGVSKGETETIDFADGSAARPMRDYYGKALMRKAEALEQLEKWTDAAAVWSLIGLGFAYGVFHAAGPGHGKAIVAAYVVANENALRRGAAIAALAAALQGLVAVALVAAVALVLGGTRRMMTDA
ncbi:MAG: hypothetical protein M1823_006625, partial [Watsoniomyces obsoletus]